MNNLALLYQAMNRPEALSLFEETYRLRLKKQGPEHQDTLINMDNLVSAYLAAGRAGEA